MKNNSNSQENNQFKQFLSSAFSKTPSAPMREFEKILQAYRGHVSEPLWFRLVGSPLSAMVAAMILILSINFSQVISDEFTSSDDPLSWVSDRETPPLIEAYSPLEEPSIKNEDQSDLGS